jgi:hypothetical protein
LTGCNPSKMIEDLVPDSKKQIAKHYIDLLIQKDFDPIVGDMDPKIKTENITETLTRMSNFFPNTGPLNRNLVGYNSSTFNNNPTQYNLTYQYGYGSKWLLVNVAFREINENKREIFGFNVHELNESLQETNRFTFKKASISHYAFFLGCILIPTFILITLIACVRTKIEKRKWLWILLILIGFVECSINWTTGQIGFQPFYFQLFGAGATASSFYSPWILSVSIPIGAILFWIKRKSLNKVQPSV